uniref:Uncharacterized protein n=1 Tax=Buteo japonicus TaxID=224669 RepID=A0A8C0C4I0_9AVES
LSCFTGKKRNPGLKIPKEAFEQPQTSSTPPRDLDSKACISIGEENFEVKADDLEPISELGRGGNSHGKICNLGRTNFCLAEF